MPELPEVETVRNGLNQTTLVQTITGGEVLLERTIASPNSTEFLQKLTNLAFQEWQRRGKYLLAKLSDSSWLGVHLRMTGSLLWCDRQAPIHKHTRVRLFLDSARELRFNDQRTFGRMWWVPATVDPATIITGLKTLGPEPFSDEFTPEYLAASFSKSDRPIKNTLLDQTAIAGIGNIYADEALFLSRIHPQQKTKELGLLQIQDLHTAVRKVLSDGIAQGGTTFSDFKDVAGLKGNYIDSAWVFRRTGNDCKVCKTKIERIKLAGRSSHFCPQCQINLSN